MFSPAPGVLLSPLLVRGQTAGMFVHEAKVQSSHLIRHQWMKSHSSPSCYCLVSLHPATLSFSLTPSPLALPHSDSLFYSAQSLNPSLLTPTLSLFTRVIRLCVLVLLLLSSAWLAQSRELQHWLAESHMAPMLSPGLGQEVCVKGKSVSERETEALNSVLHTSRMAVEA